MIATVPDYAGSAAPHTALQVSGVARLMGRTDAPIQGASTAQASTTCQVSSGCEGHLKLLAVAYVRSARLYDCLLACRKALKGSSTVARGMLCA